MTGLKISPDLTLPIAAVTEAIGWLGRRGSGKTYGAQKLAEELHRAGAQFVVLDPVGNWWALRLAADGKSQGIPVPVFGGLHGDVPLEPTAGKLIADVIADRGVSAIIDVSQFESDADKARFATDFGARFFYRKKAAPSAVHVFLEECQEFVPQNPQREEARMLHAYARLAKLGRNFGIGISMISQRPQEVNKKALNLTELLFCFQLTGPQERKTLEGWIADKGIDEDIAGELPKLKRGEPHAWSPSWLSISEVVRIAPKWTYDASSTPKVGAASVEPKPLAPIDLEKIRAAMAATIEKAKADDPAQLRRKIAELERELKGKGTATRTVDRPVIDQAAIDRAVSAVQKTFERQGAELAKLAQSLVAHASKLQPFAEQIAERVSSVKMPTITLPSTNGHRPKIERTRRVVVPDDSAEMIAGERIILTAIAQYDEGVSKDQLSVLAGYKRSSRDAYLQRLRQRGYVDFNGNSIIATDEGVAALGSTFEPLPTGEALQQYWLGKLPEGERRILEVVLGGQGDAIDKETLSEVTGYRRSSRDTYLQKLRSRRLVITERDGVRASPTLFD